jgi:hypothetical protein
MMLELLMVALVSQTQSVLGHQQVVWMVFQRLILSAPCLYPGVLSLNLESTNPW